MPTATTGGASSGRFWSQSRRVQPADRIPVTLGPDLGRQATMQAVVCDTARRAISAELDSESSGVDRGALEDHLAACAHCRAWREEAHVLTRAARLGPASSPAVPSAEARRRILAAARLSLGERSRGCGSRLSRSRSCRSRCRCRCCCSGTPTWRATWARSTYHWRSRSCSRRTSLAAPRRSGRWPATLALAVVVLAATGLALGQVRRTAAHCISMPMTPGMAAMPGMCPAPRMPHGGQAAMPSGGQGLVDRREVAREERGTK